MWGKGRMIIMPGFVMLVTLVFGCSSLGFGPKSRVTGILSVRAVLMQLDT